MESKKMEKQEYLNDVRFTKSSTLLCIKNKNGWCKLNFGNLYNNNQECQTCDDKSVAENENHILNCENLKAEESVKIDFEDVYGTVEERLKTVKIFRTIWRKREILIELKTNDWISESNKWANYHQDWWPLLHQMLCVWQLKMDGCWLTCALADIVFL